MLSESSMLIANIERTNQWTSDAMKSLPKPLGFLSKKLVSLSGDTLLVEMVVCIIPAEIFLQRYHVYQGRWLASFQDDAKMLLSMFGQRTLRSQGGNDDQDKKEKILKISDRKKQSQKVMTKAKDQRSLSMKETRLQCRHETKNTELNEDKSYSHFDLMKEFVTN
ncbi:hypothetical protein Tco_0598562 [Tanacetum coccineum]